MSDAERLARLFVEEDPHSAAQRTLEFLTAQSLAKGGVVVAVREEGLVPFVLDRLNLEQLGELRSLWQAHAQTMRHSVVVRRHTLVKLEHSDTLVGLLYILEPVSFDVDANAVFYVALAEALVAKSHTFVLPASGDSHDLNRQHMLLLLKSNDWNIARVARLMDCTRRTVYMRMARWKIPREKPPKVLKPLRAR